MIFAFIFQMVDLIQKLLNILFSLDVSNQSSVQQVSGNTPNFEDILKELIETLKNSSENFDEIIKKILQSDEKDFSDSLEDLLQYLKKTGKPEQKEDDVSKPQDDSFVYPLHIILNFVFEQQTKLQEGNVNSDSVRSDQSQSVSEDLKSISIDGKQIISDKNQNLIAESVLQEKIKNAETNIDEGTQKEKIKVSPDSFHKIDKQTHQTDKADQNNQISEIHSKQIEKPEKFVEAHRENAELKFQSDFFGEKFREKKEIKDVNQQNSLKDSAQGEFQIKEDKLLTKEISSSDLDKRSEKDINQPSHENQEISHKRSDKSEMINLTESSGEKKTEKDFIITAQKLHSALQQNNSSNNIQDSKSNNIYEIDYNSSRGDSKISELKQVILDSVKLVLNTHQKRAVMEADVLGSKVIIDVAVDNSNKLSLSITTPDTSLKSDISKHQDDLRRFLEGNNFVLQRFDVNSGFDENLNRENIFHFRGFNSSPNLNHFADEEKFSRGTVFANIKGRFLAIV